MKIAAQLSLPVNQRWRERCDLYRPAGEPIRTSEYDVAAIPDNGTAKEFIVRHHYSGSYPAARLRYGLYRHGALVGVAVYSHPCSDRVLTSVFPGRATDHVELGRFVLLDEVPGNGESWFLARTFELLRREEIAGVLSFSDPLPRALADGRVVMPGHVGTCYQASNAVYLGRGESRTLLLLPDGHALHNRALQKIRSLSHGWRYASAILERAGAEPFTPDDPVGWLERWMPQLTRRVRHPGNHKYAWAIDRRLKLFLPPSLPYPKRRFEPDAA